MRRASGEDAGRVIELNARRRCNFAHRYRGAGRTFATFEPKQRLHVCSSHLLLSPGKVRGRLGKIPRAGGRGVCRRWQRTSSAPGPDCCRCKRPRAIVQGWWREFARDAAPVRCLLREHRMEQNRGRFAPPQSLWLKGRMGKGRRLCDAHAHAQRATRPSERLSPPGRRLQSIWFSGKAQFFARALEIYAGMPGRQRLWAGFGRLRLRREPKARGLERIDERLSRLRTSGARLEEREETCEACAAALISANPQVPLNPFRTISWKGEGSSPAASGSPFCVRALASSMARLWTSRRFAAKPASPSGASRMQSLRSFTMSPTVKTLCNSTCSWTKPWVCSVSRAEARLDASCAASGPVNRLRATNSAKLASTRSNTA